MKKLLLVLSLSILSISYNHGVVDKQLKIFKNKAEEISNKAKGVWQKAKAAAQCAITDVTDNQKLLCKPACFAGSALSPLMKGLSQLDPQLAKDVANNCLCACKASNDPKAVAVLSQYT